MTLTKRYDASSAEPELHQFWQTSDTYAFDRGSQKPAYAIDTPPATVSGKLHLGHVYSYSQADFLARFWRMNGYNVFYPMGFDDNGLPTDRYIERLLGITAAQVGRSAFIERCLEISEEAERDYKALWQRLGLSIDWRYTYRTIDDLSRRTSQWSFIDLHRKGLVYRREAPTIWCSECRTAIAQADLNDLERESEFVTLPFRLENGDLLPIATTRPELLPACVAVFVHPDDARYAHLAGQRVTVPLLGFDVPLLADAKADPQKGTGAVMCCTFGDATDVEWWYTHKLPLKMLIGRDGRMTSAARDLAGLTITQARQRMIEALDAQRLLIARQPTTQTVRVHERCDTPAEYLVTQQWFVRVLDYKDDLLAAGEQIEWHPAHMKARYRAWVENLGWDWCISRQRAFGVSFPLWYCDACGEIVLADEDQLPVDPTGQQPGRACACGNTTFTPEEDVMDTWATSSMSPQIAGRWLAAPDLYGKVFPMSLRPQAHEIIRTWAFDTIVKSYHHFGALPWKHIAISGWGVAAAGAGKISKSRGGGPMPPMAMIEKYSVDAVRYWAASAGPGKDAIISEEKIMLGGKLITKLWNVASFSQRFLERYQPSHDLSNTAALPAFTPTDRWLLSNLQHVIQRVTEHFQRYDYAAARNETEGFFWRVLADNYLEFAKERLYDEVHPLRGGARYALYHALLGTLKLFAPFFPYVTESIYGELFAGSDGSDSIHLSRWPTASETLIDDGAESMGELLIEIATAVRRYKSEASLSLGTELQRLRLVTEEPAVANMLRAASVDIRSVTRAKVVEVGERGEDDGLEVIRTGEHVKVALAR